VPADSAKFTGVQSLVKQVSETTDHVDILFANAGATWGAPFDDVRPLPPNPTCYLGCKKYWECSKIERLQNMSHTFPQPSQDPHTIRSKISADSLSSIQMRRLRR